MLADVNRINPVGGSQNLDRSSIKRKKPAHKRIQPKRQQPDAHNEEERNPNKPGRLEVYA